MSRVSPATAHQVLVVEDEHDLRGALARHLRQAGFLVDEAGDGRRALGRLASGTVDLVVLDVNLPEIGGLEVLTELRRTSETPVILLTCRSAETDRVLGLELGADDYVVKPFFPRELVARVRTVLRRTAGAAPERLDFGELVIDTGSREVFVAGRLVELRPKEFELLAFLAARPRRVFSRGQLLQHVWQSAPDWQGHATVTEHVRRLRLKIECAPDHPRWMVTVRGMGYRFDP
jgi:two-component system, OmpR family, phosphate regulon response regulator PhoB